jgi:hypothetical protein
VPSESLSCDIYNFHESVYQHLLLLSHSQLLELTHFRSLLSIWPPTYPWDGILNPIATEFLPHCHLIVEGGTLEQNSAFFHQTPASQNTTAEARLMLEKGIVERPQRWYATSKSLPAPDAEDDNDSCYILTEDIDSTSLRNNDIPFATAVLYGLTSRMENVPQKDVTPLNPKAAEWSPTINLSSKTSPRFDRIKMTKDNTLFSNTPVKFKTHEISIPQNDTNVGSQTSTLVLPAFCSPPLRNGGYTFFADGLDHEAFNDEPNDDPALLFLDTVPLSKIYAQISSKTKQLHDLASRGDPGKWMFYDSGASRTVIQTESPLRPLLTQV